VSRPSLLPPLPPAPRPRTDHVVTGGYRITTGLSAAQEASAPQMQEARWVAMSVRACIESEEWLRVGHSRPAVSCWIQSFLRAGSKIS
jgi:hypothetical protein